MLKEYTHTLMRPYLEGNQVDFGPPFLGAGAFHGPFRNDVELVPLFALGDDVLALGEGLFHQRRRHLVHHLVVQGLQIAIWMRKKEATTEEEEE